MLVLKKGIMFLSSQKAKGATMKGACNLFFLSRQVRGWENDRSMEVYRSLQKKANSSLKQNAHIGR